MRTLYNAKSAHYRALIKTWADYSAHTAGHPEIAAVKPLAENDLLRKIADPALRGVFGSMIAERNRLRSEVTLLRAQANIVVDRRVFPGDIQLSKGQVGAAAPQTLAAFEYFRREGRVRSGSP